MRVMVKCGAGIDVHKKSVVVNCRRVEGQTIETDTRTFGTTTAELLTMTDWLASWGVTHVAMESTGVYWHPVYNLLEGSYEVLVVNAKHIKHVPGRKTDVKDAEWIAELLSYGLLKASFVPEKPQRDVRDLTRYRTKLVQERAREVNRVQKLLEGANIKLASVATDILGVSGRLMLDALITGEADEKTMAEMAKGRMRSKIPELEQALTGIVSDHHRFLLSQQLTHIDFMDEQIAKISHEISVRMEKMSQAPPPSSASVDQDKREPTEADETPLTWSVAVELLDTVPGINQRAQGSAKMTLTFIILGVTVILFIHGKLRSDLVALMSLLALFLAGILTSEQALAGFSDSTVILIAALFVVGEGLSRTGVTAWMGNKVLHLAGSSKVRLLVVLMVGTAVLSAFISNTGTVATLLPPSWPPPGASAASPPNS
jgi:transposase